MQGIILELVPIALTGFVSLCVGIGGALKYGKGNGKSNGKYVTAREFGVFRKDVKTDFNILFVKMDHLSDRMGILGESVARIQGQHEKRT